MTHSFKASLLALAASALLAACGGSDPDTAQASAAPEARKQALAVPPGTTIPADASSKGLFGPVQNWPLIPLHVVLTPDGRVMSYGTQATGQQTAFFIYDVWDPSDNSHLTLANNTATDIFCSSQMLLPGGEAVVISGGDNWTGSGTTNTGNNNSNVFCSGRPQPRARQQHEPRALVLQHHDAAQRRAVRPGRHRRHRSP